MNASIEFHCCNKAYATVQLLSSIIVVSAPLLDFMQLGEGLSVICTINSHLFFLVFLGFNIICLSKQESRWTIITLLPLLPLIGTFLSMASGYAFLLSQVPHYSLISVIALGVMNCIVTLHNFKTRKQLTITFEREHISIIIFACIFLLFRVLMLNDQNLYLDDELYFNSCLKFINNDSTITNKVFSDYYLRDLDWVYPWGFPIMLGVFLKGGIVHSTVQALMSAKVYVQVLNTFLVFPLYSFFQKFTKNHRVNMMLVGIVIFNQWNLIEAPYLLVDTVYMLFFTISIVYFWNVLDAKENAEQDLVLSILAASTAFFIRPNGIVQGVVLICILGIIGIIGCARKGNPEFLFRVPFIKSIQAPKIKSLSKFAFIQFSFIIFFYMLHQLEYVAQNGISIYQFITKFTNYAYFREGNVGQFTPVDGFTIPWLFERLAINLPFYALNFTQLTGFLIDPFGGIEIKQFINLLFSIPLFMLTLVGFFTFWLKNLRRKTLHVIFHFLLIVTTFLPVILWGETYAVLHRLSVPLLVLVIPQVYTVTHDMMESLNRKYWKNMKVERVMEWLTMFCVIITLYVAIGFSLVIFLKNPSTLLEFIAWQFANI